MQQGRSLNREKAMVFAPAFPRWEVPVGLVLVRLEVGARIGAGTEKLTMLARDEGVGTCQKTASTFPRALALRTVSLPHSTVVQSVAFMYFHDENNLRLRQPVDAFFIRMYMC